MEISIYEEEEKKEDLECETCEKEFPINEFYSLICNHRQCISCYKSYV